MNEAISKGRLTRIQGIKVRLGEVLGEAKELADADPDFSCLRAIVTDAREEAEMLEDMYGGPKG